ncbi:hypothetical protein HBN50_12085 [Halobacteriovorax sp. GB3]|uniref:hypothetical protein n=1 Tax=Halobacteriovorax sp. GB3 TaxID=2719615 RepID=UPI0023600943|nr:hypothetical protein [Halobacteriovorax sp. GB3]MDD0853841.1 hypothetical protein [Halobacteriovorax sp. GB3]
MESNQNEIDYLAEQTLKLSESLKNKTFLNTTVFDEDLIEFEKLKESFQFEPLEVNEEVCDLDLSESCASLEEIEALCQGVLGHDLSFSEEDRQRDLKEDFVSYEFQELESRTLPNSDALSFFKDFNLPLEEETELVDIVVELEEPCEEIFEENFKENVEEKDDELLDIVVDLDEDIEDFLEEEEELLDIVVELEWDDENDLTFNEEEIVGPALEIETEQECVVEQQSAIAYHVLESSLTFCVKAIAVKDIHQFELTDEVRAQLKLNQDQAPEFFITDCYERAQLTLTQIANRRFTKEEDMICNIGDPGFSWWLEKSDHGFSIYFKSYKVNRVDEAIRLGPLGDVQYAVRKFSWLSALFKEHFPVSEFSCDDTALHFYTSKQNDESMNHLIQVFEEGICSFDEEDFHLENDSLGLFYYLSEISDIRSWWLDIHDAMNA